MSTLNPSQGGSAVKTDNHIGGIRQLALTLANQQTSAQQMVELALARAAGSHSVFITLTEDLIGQARAIDRARHAGQTVAPLSGIPVAIKDLFNLRGEKTLAGSRVRQHDARIEAQDARVVAPLRAAGLLFLGRTNMSEFAFSGIGKNPHHGTALSVWDRDTGRLPGGSSSGSAVAVGEAIVAAALGSDTAGSCRIPAAFNGVVGVKPSFGRMSLDGIFPLSPTLDAPGPIAIDVDSCHILDQLMCAATEPNRLPDPLLAMPVKDLQLVIPDARVMADLDREVSTAFELALERLERGGAKIRRLLMPVLDHCEDCFVERPLVVREAWLHHRQRLEQFADEFDPFVSSRMLAGAQIDEQEQQSRLQERQRLVDEFRQCFRLMDADALIYPTVACIPPPLAATEDAEAARRVNLRCLRNTATVNYFDGCAISLPCQRPGEAPVGLMLAAANGDDEHLYRIAAAVEALLAGQGFRGRTSLARRTE